MPTEEHKAHLYEPEEREQKLPQWAQYLLLDMRREMRALRSTLDATKGDHPDSNVKLWGTTVGEHVDLRKNSHISFKMEAGNVQVYHERNGRLRVQGDYRLVVYPEASNALSVELEGDHDHLNR